MTEKQKHCKRERLFAFLWRKWRIQRWFQKHLEYKGDFSSPRTFEEKIQYRKLWGNHNFYALVSDKYLVREYIAEKVGEIYLVPLLGVYNQLSTDSFDSLPCRFVIKANHGCNWNQIVWDKNELDFEATCQYFNRLIRKKYGSSTGEIHYRMIEQKIIIEELLLDGKNIPVDYSFHCYNSRESFNCTITIKQHAEGGCTHFDRDWNYIGGTELGVTGERYIRPENHAEMLTIAEKLSSDFDYVRVDLYNIGGQIFCGEITTTPGGGFKGAANELCARLRSEMWKLDTENRLLYQDPQSRLPFI